MPTESNSNLFRDTLIALRDRYLTLAPTSAQETSHAREQLNHINALLVDQMIEPGTSAIAPPAQLSLASRDLPALLSSSAPLAIADKSTPSVKAPLQQPKPTAASKLKAKVAPKPVTMLGGDQEKPNGIRYCPCCRRLQVCLRRKRSPS
ncbi:MAG: hypothetical protein KME35_00515 [Aphanocapsa sp. GSE-SYN-MK-11-07L]|jgi:hypothetical protein|nr:hypothetical protein [Aphanocapsa sp. GSE-SYN-MK-11-07L]